MAQVNGVSWDDLKQITVRIPCLERPLEIDRGRLSRKNSPMNRFRNNGCLKKHFRPNTRTSAVAERPRDASCHWIFREITRGHSLSFEM